MYIKELHNGRRKTLHLKNKFSAKHLNVNSFISMLKVKFQCEKYIANINNKVAKFVKKMDSILQSFNNNQENNNNDNNSYHLQNNG